TRRRYCAKTQRQRFPRDARGLPQCAPPLTCERKRKTSKEEVCLTQGPSGGYLHIPFKVKEFQVVIQLRREDVDFSAVVHPQRGCPKALHLYVKGLLPLRGLEELEATVLSSFSSHEAPQ